MFFVSLSIFDASDCQYNQVTLEAIWFFPQKKTKSYISQKMNEKMESWRAINKALTKEALTMFGSFPSPKSLNLSESKSFQSPSCCRSAIECLEKSILIFPSTSSLPSSSFSSSTSTQAPPPSVLEKCNKMCGKSLSYIIIQQMGGPRIPLEEMILLFSSFIEEKPALEIWIVSSEKMLLKKRSRSSMNAFFRFFRFWSITWHLTS